MTNPSPPSDAESSTQDARETELCVHVFSVSAGLVGVCLTVIGLFRVVLRLQNVNDAADNILAVDALGFLIATVVAYLALRSRDHARRRRLEHVADRFFIGALSLMALVCTLIAYELM